MAFSLRYFLCLLLISIPEISASAQTTPEHIIHTLDKQVVLLRDGYADDQLAFNAQGDLAGTPVTGNFPLSAITIQKIRLTTSGLEIQGHRDILAFTGSRQNPKEIQFVPTDRSVHITVRHDPAHPEALAAAVNRIFALDIQNLLAEKTPPQQEAWLYSLPMFHSEDLSGVPAKQNAPIAIDLKNLRTLGTNVTLPKLLSHVDLQYSEEAREKKVNGICTVSLTVDQNGNPAHIRVLQPPGMGLDENAVVAVSQYWFAPAKSNGQPVSVTLPIEVNFKIY